MLDEEGYSQREYEATVGDERRYRAGRWIFAASSQTYPRRPASAALCGRLSFRCLLYSMTSFVSPVLAFSFLTTAQIPSKATMQPATNPTSTLADISDTPKRLRLTAWVRFDALVILL